MLSTDEYGHIMSNWSVLKDQKKDAKELGLHHKGKAQNYKDLFDRLQLEEEFYTNFLKGAIEEYEVAHPPEEM